ncbi:MAG: c-type cytochrome domain-containing protein, partial [Planctomycetaceae bacterium]
GVADAEPVAKAAAEKLAAAQKVAADAVAAAKAAEAALATIKENLAKAQEASKQADTVVAAARTEVEATQAALVAVATEATTALKASEDALASIGQFVSFSKHIAPVFNKRCLACHNAQSAKGRYNMDTFLGVMKGGEQGLAILAKDPDGSNLLAQIEDGTMPKDADPLSKEEIAAIRQWSKNGARLDAGIKETAPLVTIAPKLPQPMPPEAYRVPIPVTSVAFTPDGSQVASSGYHEVVLWNAADGKLIRRVTNIAERTYDIEFSPDGKLLAVAAGNPGQQGEVKLFNPADGTLVRDVTTTSDSVFAVAFSPDGKRLATCSADRSIRVFNVETGAQELLIEDHADWVMDIAWSPDGAKLASASRDKTSKLFDAKTGDSLVTFPGHAEVVYGVSFSPDGAQVLTAGRDNKIRVWNPANAQQVREITGFGGEVYRVVVSPDGRIFSCSSDKQAREHKLADGAAVRAFAGHNDWVYGVAFHPASKRVVTGSWDGEIRIWNAEDAKGMVNFIGAPGLAQPTVTAAAN